MSQATSAAEQPQSTPEPKRIRGFANYFKDYMGISAIVTAALPIPVTAAKLIPTYSAQARFLSVYTSLFCFLLLGFVFFIRHRLVGAMFQRRSDGSFGNKRFAYVPPALIILCLMLILTYHAVLEASVSKVAGSSRTAEVLAGLDERAIPFGTVLMLVYLGVFLSAEGAFILMATKEYLQDVLGISDTELLGGALQPIRILRVSCHTTGAKVLVDNQQVGYVPCEIKVAPGDHVITLMKDGYQSCSGTVKIAETERFHEFFSIPFLQRKFDSDTARDS